MAFRVVEKKKGSFLRILCHSGIDVAQVTIVVHFSLPTNRQKQPDFETYLHRIGRTGRFGKRGIAFNMVDSHSTHLVRCIEEHFRECPCSLVPLVLQCSQGLPAHHLVVHFSLFSLPQ